VNFYKAKKENCRRKTLGKDVDKSFPSEREKIEKNDTTTMGGKGRVFVRDYAA